MKRMKYSVAIPELRTHEMEVEFAGDTPGDPDELEQILHDLWVWQEDSRYVRNGVVRSVKITYDVDAINMEDPTFNPAD